MTPPPPKTSAKSKAKAKAKAKSCPMVSKIEQVLEKDTLTEHLRRLKDKQLREKEARKKIVAGDPQCRKAQKSLAQARETADGRGFAAGVDVPQDRPTEPGEYSAKRGAWHWLWAQRS